MKPISDSIPSISESSYWGFFFTSTSSTEQLRVGNKTVTPKGSIFEVIVCVDSSRCFRRLNCLGSGCQVRFQKFSLWNSVCFLRALLGAFKFTICVSVCIMWDQGTSPIWTFIYYMFILEISPVPFLISVFFMCCVLDFELLVYDVVVIEGVSWDLRPGLNLNFVGQINRSQSSPTTQLFFLGSFICG